MHSTLAHYVISISQKHIGDITFIKISNHRNDKISSWLELNFRYCHLPVKVQEKPIVFLTGGKSTQLLNGPEMHIIFSDSSEAPQTSSEGQSDV